MEQLKHWGIKSHQKAWLDRISKMSEMMYDITIAYAQLERNLIGERVKTGMDQAKCEGKTLGRFRITKDPKRAQQLTQAV
ncbi:MAG TPA: hypothetical protein DD856_19110 [Sulfobacillus sp.]|nr:hypothetical protein [Sulfobacillus sp.]